MKTSIYKEVCIHSDGQVITSYTYDGNGLRTSKTTNGITTRFVNDRGNVAGEIVGENVYSYVRGNGLASYFDGTNVGIYTSNLHGDVSQIIAYGQKSLAKYGFDAFGNENSAANTVHNPFGYCGEYLDEETGFIYLRARYYDPDAGRFISEDPIKDGVNWYVYCGNNPVMYVDPWGLKDYIYTSQTEYYVENDSGVWEFLKADRYYAEIDGKRYLANSKETVTLYAWNSFDTNFLNGTLDSLVNKANEESTDAKRILSESVGGDLDFKLQMDKEKLYLAKGILYNRNEAGNFVWAYFLESKNVSGYISGALAQGGSLISPLVNMGGLPRLDEEWDRKARWAGVEYYYSRNDKWWVYFILYFGDPHP